MRSIDHPNNSLAIIKAFFNEEKAAADLKASQKDERADINKRISEAQDRIAILKDEYAKDTAVIQSRIDKLREGDTDDKSDVYAQIKEAEANILKAQDNIDDLIIDREPLEAKMIKLEAEVGPVKYIACLLYTSPSPRDRQKYRMPSSA